MRPRGAALPRPDRRAAQNAARATAATHRARARAPAAPGSSFVRSAPSSLTQPPLHTPHTPHQHQHQVLADVRSIIAEQLGADLDKVGPDAKFADLGADSLDTVEIMMALEEKFEVTLDEDGAEGLSTVQDAADLISSKLA